MADYEENKKSRFNAGVAHAERIDSLQRSINAAKFNPILRNMDTGTFNYEVMLVSADCLVAEGWGKFSDPERVMITRINNTIKSMNEYFPPVSVDKNGYTKINKDNYKKLLDLFEMYERKIKELYDLHDLNSPSMGDDDGDYDY